ncbi:MAG: hypothetical protein ACRDF6_12785 [bacterium]
MRAAGADIIVVLSHLDTRTEAQRIARTVSGIDLMLGTHIGEPLATPQRINGTLLSVPDRGVGSFGDLGLTIRDGHIAHAALHQHTVDANERRIGRSSASCLGPMPLGALTRRAHSHPRWWVRRPVFRVIDSDRITSGLPATAGRAKSPPARSSQRCHETADSS